jgi:hypothetical protein
MLGFLKNVQGLIASVIANHGIQIYANAKDEAEYRKMRRLLGADNNKNTLDCQDINDALLANGITSLAGKEELLLLHDVNLNYWKFMLSAIPQNFLNVVK